jgi:hypothetical protein
LALFIEASLCASAAEVSLEFSALISSQGRVQFMLTERTSGQRSGWLNEGDAFRGYTVSGFNAKDETLRLKKAETEFTLPLKSGKVTSGGANMPPLLAYQLDSEGKIGDLETLKKLLLGIAGNSSEVRIELTYGAANFPKNMGQIMKTVHDLCKELGLNPVDVKLVKR